jgi:hypothetical protein
MKEKINNIIDKFKTNWKTPKEGNSLSLKEFGMLAVGGMGVNGMQYVGSQMVFFAVNCILLAQIFMIDVMHIAYIAFIGQIFSLALRPIHMMITDNLGSLKANTSKWLHIGMLAAAAAGIGILFIPMTTFERLLMIALPQVIGVWLLANIVGVYFRWFLLKTFSKRFGKFKPWLIFAGIPNAITMTAITFIPYRTMEYANLLI